MPIISINWDATGKPRGVSSMADEPISFGYEDDLGPLRTEWVTHMKNVKVMRAVLEWHGLEPSLISVDNYDETGYMEIQKTKGGKPILQKNGEFKKVHRPWPDHKIWRDLQIVGDL